MSVSKYVMLMCDYGDGTCGEESPSCFTETQARKDARKAGWKVGRSRNDPDYCPRHAGAGLSDEKGGR